MEPVKKQSNIGVGFAAIGAVLIAAIGVFASTFNPPAQSAVTPIENSPVVSTPNPASQAVKTSSQPATKHISTPVSSVYRDGSYSATGSYDSPGGEDQVVVTLSLRNDIVTSVTVIPETQDRISSYYQTMFISGYKQYVVGKDISSVHVEQVSGSSLTGIGFNAAIAKIEAEAKA